MQRRNAIYTITGLSAFGLVMPGFIFNSCSSDLKLSRLFNEDQIILLNEIGEVMLPSSPDSPGAKEARVGETIDILLVNCYPKTMQETVINGLASFKTFCNHHFNKSFLNLDAEEKLSCLELLNEEAKEQGQMHYLHTIRNLILFSYFTSEPGMTKSLRYVAIPGKQIGDFDYTEGDKAWAL